MKKFLIEIKIEEILPHDNFGTLKRSKSYRKHARATISSSLHLPRPWICHLWMNFDRRRNQGRFSAVVLYLQVYATIVWQDLQIRLLIYVKNK